MCCTAWGPALQQQYGTLGRQVATATVRVWRRMLGLV